MTYLLAIFAGLVLDLFSLALTLRRNRGRRGPSGMPVVPFLLYMVPLLSGHSVFSESRLVDLAIFMGLHVFLRYVIPYVDRRFVVAR